MQRQSPSGNAALPIDALPLILVLDEVAAIGAEEIPFSRRADLRLAVAAGVRLLARDPRPEGRPEIALIDSKLLEVSPVQSGLVIGIGRKLIVVVSRRGVPAHEALEVDARKRKNAHGLAPVRLTRRGECSPLQPFPIELNRWTEHALALPLGALQGPDEVERV